MSIKDESKADSSKGIINKETRITENNDGNKSY